MLDNDLVFLGYSRDPDEAFAVQLADWLRRCGVDVWLDLERIPKGHKPRPLIEEALTATRRALFLVSKRWLDRDWTQFEVSRFVHLDAQRVRVAILRSPDITSQLPPELSLSRPIVWTDAEPAPAARFWEVYCALTGTPPGPPARWNARGEEALARRATSPVSFPAPVPAPPEPTVKGPAPQLGRRTHLRLALLGAGAVALAAVLVKQVRSDTPAPSVPARTSVAPEPPPATGLVQVKVNVPARILLDGREVAASASEVALPLPVGERRLHVEAPGRAPRDLTFVNKPGGTALVVDLQLPEVSRLRQRRIETPKVTAVKRAWD